MKAYRRDKYGMLELYCSLCKEWLPECDFKDKPIGRCEKSDICFECQKRLWREATQRRRDSLRARGLSVRMRPLDKPYERYKGWKVKNEATWVHNNIDKFKEQ
jgi:hypothetical protein